MDPNVLKGLGILKCLLVDQKVNDCSCKDNQLAFVIS